MEALMMIMFWCLILIMMIIVICRVMIGVLDMIWWHPKRIQSMLSKQGIRGPKPSFLYGNVKQIQQMEKNIKSSSSSSSDGQPAVSHHQWLSSSFPYLQEWSRLYGRTYMFSTGTKQHLYMNQPELIKELKQHKSLDLGKPSYLSKARRHILGNGVLKANGHHWALQKKLIAPHFFPLQVKGMVGLMEECTATMIRAWEQRLAAESQRGVAEFKVDQDLKDLSIDILSRAFFGSSYYLGKTISKNLRAMEETLAKPSLLFGLPYLGFLPTQGRRKIWKLEKEVEALILNVVKGRQEDAGKYSKDILQMILERASTDIELQHDEHKMERFMVDTCTNIYFAGYETIVSSASWTLMLLALHPEWQKRVRSEIFEICGDHIPSMSLDWDKLSQFKTLGNAILESLRLYAPSAVIAREAFADIKLGGGDSNGNNFVVPKGVHIWSFVPLLHRDSDNWGPDANEFNPDRFRGGISEACKHPQAYVPFGYGTRLCLGQSFAMLQLKLVLCLLLSRFSFSVSPNYRHSPVYKMLLMPQHGMRLLVEKV
ncbi:hypothetical protein Ddye_011961 [Dipteronia dyeriana]|uniref:Cytochrome P450 n=1 Tax=Dipteronia dyeriana TaxID=168575 RepID=A0AAE0CHY6_9ROSI|nr:hypothetical protein Ddye_011961 [Dipteronia dyeriana]